MSLWFLGVLEAVFRQKSTLKMYLLWARVCELHTFFEGVKHSMDGPYVARYVVKIQYHCRTYAFDWLTVPLRFYE